jgi:3-isopropylmalate/(R)-2-methylmalate dehydratase small subunit
MEPFVTHRGRLALLPWSDVNTDLIIPARYLKRVERTGYGSLLFADKRYAPGGEPPIDDPEKHGALAADFPLNAPTAQGATILVVGPNFGCGSSREHAVWAVRQAGFRALIAPGKNEGFADIFEGNSYNNGLLPIELPPADWQRVANVAETGAEATIDLQSLFITLHSTNAKVPFDVPATQRDRLLKGLDAIGETLLLETAIAAHEKGMQNWMAPG